MSTTNIPSLQQLRSLMDSVPKAPMRSMVVVPKGTKLPFNAAPGHGFIDGLRIIESEYVDTPKLIPALDPSRDFFKPEPFKIQETSYVPFRVRYDIQVIRPVYSPIFVSVPARKCRRMMPYVGNRRRQINLSKQCVRILNLFKAGMLKNPRALRKVANLLERYDHKPAASKLRLMMLQAEAAEKDNAAKRGWKGK